MAGAGERAVVLQRADDQVRAGGEAGAGGEHRGVRLRAVVDGGGAQRTWRAAGPAGRAGGVDEQRPRRSAECRPGARGARGSRVPSRPRPGHLRCAVHDDRLDAGRLRRLRDGGQAGRAGHDSDDACVGELVGHLACGQLARDRDGADAGEDARHVGQDGRAAVLAEDRDPVVRPGRPRPAAGRPPRRPGGPPRTRTRSVSSSTRAVPEGSCSAFAPRRPCRCTRAPSEEVRQCLPDCSHSQETESRSRCAEVVPLRRPGLPPRVRQGVARAGPPGRGPGLLGAAHLRPLPRARDRCRTQPGTGR